jgi:ATP-binding cassette subfamily B protein
MISFRKTMGRIFHLQYKKNDDVSSDLQDVISGMRVVKTYGKEVEESERFKQVAGDFAIIQKRNERFWAGFDFIVSVLMGLGVVVVVYFGGLDVFNGSMSAGELYQFITYTLLLFQYVGWLGRLPREITRLTSSLERIYDILAQDVDEERKDLKEFDIKGEITFDHATFGYKSYQPVLENINAVVKPGEMIGIVGASGAGKSTLINLMMRLYETDDGSILVDGVDMKDISRGSYHSQLGVVLQETFLFSGTIIDNIRFSKPNATVEEIIKAAKLANAHDFICSLPDGYNTYVGEKGYTLSGGERQRIAIARAILPDPKILILDEATASLDTESEFMIQKALERLTRGKTTFAIAHRLSTLKNADRIMVIDDHRIAEFGTHKELLDNKGIYYNLFTAQTS